MLFQYPILWIPNSPGLINTNNGDSTGNPIYDEQVKKFIETFVKATPLRREGEPLDIAKGIVFLSSIDAQFITGANLVIDGGVMLSFPIDLLSFFSF